MYPSSLERYSYNIHYDNYKMATSYADRHFINCLQKPPHMRTEQDLDVIFAYLHGMEALSSLREPALRALCRTVRYEYHDANDILYCQSELSTCWYILLSGSVFIEGSMFLPRSSFGKRTPGCARRASECLILEPSEMIVIDYPDVHMTKAPSRPGYNTMNLDRLPMYDPNDDICMQRMNPDGVTDQLVPDIQVGYTTKDQYLRNDQCLRNESYSYKRSSRASDTSSAYSGSDMMQSSLDDQDNADIDLSGLVESIVDSDEEEGYADSTESLPVRDAVRECLEKEPKERKEDDIVVLLDFMQHFRAFANMTLATRRELCAVMVFAVVEKAGTIVMNNGEILDSWSVILNGQVEITRPDGSCEILQMGDSFGTKPTVEKQCHYGTMHTLVDDCQFVCIAQEDYYQILHKGEENTQRHEEKGRVVMVTERREFDGGNRKGHIVIRGTPERLMQQLVEDHSVVDPTFVEDFLLTYRTFLPNAIELCTKLLQWFEVPALRAKVTRVVLLWVNNHFNDFETDNDMCEFLEAFEQLLERERMSGQLRLLNLACASKARSRTITLTRATREEILHFSVLGGQERGYGIFVSKVEKVSKAYDAGLKRGDQILEVNGHNFQCISHNRALEILRGTTHLSITVKSNLLGYTWQPVLLVEEEPGQPRERTTDPREATGKLSHITTFAESLTRTHANREFKEMLHNQEKNAPQKRQEFSSHQKQRLSAPDLENALSPLKEKSSGKKDKSLMMTIAGSKPKIRKALKSLIPRNMSSNNMNNDTNLNHSDENLYVSRLSRKSSTSSSSSSNAGLSNHLSASNPDLLMAGNLNQDEPKEEFPEHVIKVYRADQSFKYLLIHKDTTAREVVMLSLREFGLTDPSSNFSLCEVTVESEGFIKQKRLADSFTNLPERLSLNGRYYLKNNMSTEPLVPDELMGDLIKEGQISLIQLNTTEVASQLTLEDFKVFKEIQDTEYIDDLFKIKSKFWTPNLNKFSELVNKEMFWVVTEICSEANLVKRMKIIKHFVKIARHCKDCKNFNTMFAIISGLNHNAVCRLHNTWEKLPNKYKKIYEDLQLLMDPSRNMSKYRNLINSEFVQPPMLPFFPVVKKDLTFIDLGNDSVVDGLINFEKLRMVAKEVRHICNMCSAKYDVSTMYLGTPSMYDSSWLSGMATMKRTKNRRGSAIPNARKMFEEAQMTRRVRSYLSNMPVNRDEDKLIELSHQCEPPAKKCDSTPSIASSSSNSSLTDDKRPVYTGPKFGAGTVENTRKLMALSDKVRPHDPKVPLPPVTSPNLSGRRPPQSPRHVKQNPVHLSSESSSVVSLSNIAYQHRKPSRTGSMGSTESTGSVNSNHGHPYETDSGHNSMTSSSNFDSNSSMCSVGSSSITPPSSRKSSHPNLPPYHHHHHHHNHPPQTAMSNAYQNAPPLPSPPVRPPLPPYHVIVQNSPANSQFIHQTYTTQRRPPLPDYHVATKQMAQFARQRQRWENGQTQMHAGLASSYSYVPDYDDAADDLDEEQVSAV